MAIENQDHLAMVLGPLTEMGHPREKYILEPFNEEHFSDESFFCSADGVVMSIK
jgi:hypothetical protein